MLRLDAHTEGSRLADILKQIPKGGSLAVVTDAGTPGISDPGAALVDKAYEAGFEVESVPGPSAVSNALALSGFFAQRYAFLGYLPRKKGAFQQELRAYGDSTLTIVLFESPFRVTKSLEMVLEVLGDRRACLCREMTKLHQQVLRGGLSELIASNPPTKGEYTIVIEGKRHAIAENR